MLVISDVFKIHSHIFWLLCPCNYVCSNVPYFWPGCLQCGLACNGTPNTWIGNAGPPCAFEGCSVPALRPADPPFHIPSVMQQLIEAASLGSSDPLPWQHESFQEGSIFVAALCTWEGGCGLGGLGVCFGSGKGGGEGVPVGFWAQSSHAFGSSQMVCVLSKVSAVQHKVHCTLLPMRLNCCLQPLCWQPLCTWPPGFAASADLWYKFGNGTHICAVLTGADMYS